MTVSDEHITRAARAIFEESDKSGFLVWGSDSWDDVGEAVQRAFKDQAKAALEAVGDVIPPTDDVVDAEQIRAAVAMCYPEDMTPSAKRTFDSILENAARGVVLPEPRDEIFDDFGDAGEWSVRPEPPEPK